MPKTVADSKGLAVAATAALTFLEIISTSRHKEYFHNLPCGRYHRYGICFVLSALTMGSAIIIISDAVCYRLVAYRSQELLGINFSAPCYGHFLTVYRTANANYHTELGKHFIASAVSEHQAAPLLHSPRRAWTVSERYRGGCALHH
ncbi:hypothetical protein E2C01_000889 [Portunus trituberculatus]|uniref:Uncharacterized protein n=1 Tax=Portunus trituberculatus TaxID=210409 RepID=A0A5B7CGB6_PORTR|nr:hypothetical protein [Portunus trituberculatus]